MHMTMRALIMEGTLVVTVTIREQLGKRLGICVWTVVCISIYIYKYMNTYGEKTILVYGDCL